MGYEWELDKRLRGDKRFNYWKCIILLQNVQKKSWVAQFKEFRAYGECVLDYLRSQVLTIHHHSSMINTIIIIVLTFEDFQGMNAHFILRVATDRDWAADVRAQSFWLEETNRSVSLQCRRFFGFTFSNV